MSLDEFMDKLASSAPTPGGGGAAALCGALAASLGAMAVRLTKGKKKFLPYEEEHEKMILSLDELRVRFLSLIERDAAAFEPLSKVYAMDKSAPDYAEKKRTATINAASAPLEMLRACRDCADILAALEDKCSAMLISDLGCAASLCASAAECAAINVLVNTRTLPDDEKAAEIASDAKELLSSVQSAMQPLAERIINKLMA